MSSQRYSFICANGCGECDVRIRPFETYRSEDHEGNLLESRSVPELVSKCCGSEVEVWDELARNGNGDTVAGGSLVYYGDELDNLSSTLVRAVERGNMADVLSVLLGAAVGLLETMIQQRGEDPSLELKIDGGEQGRDITIHPTKTKEDSTC